MAGRPAARLTLRRAPSTRQTRYTLQFGQVYIGRPTETDEHSARPLYPNEARLRDCTYSGIMQCDVTVKKERSGAEPTVVTRRVPLGRLPIMLHSDFCHLKLMKTESELMEFKECPLDQGGYFIIRGSEKVLIAQERLCNNKVFVFQLPRNSKYSHVAECVSRLDGSHVAPRTFYLKLPSETPAIGSQNARAICASIPFVQTDVSIVVLLWALGFETDRDVIGHIIFDESDVEMMNLLRPSLEAADEIMVEGAGNDRVQTAALDFIGRRAVLVVRCWPALPATARGWCQRWP